MKKLIYFELRKIFSKRLSMVTLIGILLFSALLSFPPIKINTLLTRTPVKVPAKQQ